MDLAEIMGPFGSATNPEDWTTDFRGSISSYLLSSEKSALKENVTQRKKEIISDVDFECLHEENHSVSNKPRIESQMAGDINFPMILKKVQFQNLIVKKMKLRIYGTVMTTTQISIAIAIVRQNLFQIRTSIKILILIMILVLKIILISRIYSLDKI